MNYEDRLSIAEQSPDKLTQALKIAVEALEWFDRNETFVYEGKDWPVSVSDKAADAIAQIKELVE